MNWYAGPEHEPFAFDADGGDGAGALLLHGFTGTPREMRPLGRALATAGIAAHGPLLPGFGPGIGRLGEIAAAEWRAAAVSAWEEVAGRYARSVLVGYSMGGALALHAAARRAPDRLILLAPLWRFADWRAVALPVVKRVKKTLPAFQGSDFADPAVRDYLAAMDPALDLDDPTALDRLRRETGLPTASLDELRRLAAPAGALAARVTASTLIVQGGRDTIVTPRHTRRLVARFGGLVAYHELPADHLLVIEDRPTWPRVRDLTVRFATGLGEAGG
ncbi:MAG: hypothetical protein AVDCRST_MAG73-1132 [uncultured Thermomicrobiales bacterium]|uniref:Serine aminopeptidase S33 domain-containing protein n=1 Tax=uncultured Thermomicrobiales bacterium TaxID=1645740 RepID=A0A6J4TWS1_9BACT|nr:MAG: hypothetical protein AVDCRST_MAG73-1132 [uncultured Thermomicrobiales bacterium]